MAEVDNLKVEVVSGESALGDGSSVKSESYYWQEKPVQLNITNASKTVAANIVVVEWKKKTAGSLFGFLNN